MSLPDQNTGMVDGFSEATLENLCLKTTLQEVLDFEGQHVIETHTGFIEHTNANKTTDEGVTLKQTLGVFAVELQELTGSTTNLREGETDTPYLTFVTEAVLAGKLPEDAKPLC
jgi:hypothetical protein